MVLFGKPNVEKMRTAGNVAGLVKALNYDRDWHIRRDVANALAEVCQRTEDAGPIAQALEALITRLFRELDGDVEEAFNTAFESLHNRLIQVQPTSSSVKVLTGMFTHQEELVRAFSILALGKICEAHNDEVSLSYLSSALKPLSNVLKDTQTGTDPRRNCCFALAAIGSRIPESTLLVDAIETLITVFVQDKDTRVRDVAAEALGKIGARLQDVVLVKRLVRMLMDGLNAQEREVCRASAFHLRYFSARLAGIGMVNEVISVLIPLLQDREQNTRRDVVETLGKISQNLEDTKPMVPAIGVLIGLLNVPDESERAQAALTLSGIGAPAVEPLIIALKAKEPLVRHYACFALREIVDVRAVEPFIAALQDEVRMVRFHAQVGLQKLLDSDLVDPQQKGRIQEVLKQSQN